MNNKAQTFTIFQFIIVAFLTVLFFGGLIYIMGILNDTFHEVGIANEANAGQPMYVNMTLAADQIWGNAYTSIQALRMVSVVYILALAIGIIVVGALERKHPFLFFIYILVTILGIIFAPTISNAYETILASGIYGGELANFTASNFILLNLPTIVMVVGILGAIFLFVNLVRSPSDSLDYSGRIR